MHRTSWALAAVVLATATGFAKADTILPGDSSVRYSANVDGFYVSNDNLDLFGANSWAESANAGTAWSVEAGATSGNYADAGIVVGFDGSLTLGQFQSVTVNLLPGAGQTTPSVNLWLDTGGDNQFFAFNGSGLLTGLAGDTYFGASAGNVNSATTFDFLGGAGGNGQYTLAQLQSGARAGVDGNTKVALWIGVTNGGYFTPNYADISSVNVATATAVPLPASAWSGFALLAGFAAVGGVKRMRRQLV